MWQFMVVLCNMWRIIGAPNPEESLWLVNTQMRNWFMIKFRDMHQIYWSAKIDLI